MNIYKKIIFSLAVWAFLFLLFCPIITRAAAPDPAAVAANTPPTVTLENPLGETTTVPVLIGKVIAGAMGILGAVAMFVMVLGGFSWLTSGGNEEKVKKGTQAMLWAAIGIVFALSSYVLVRTWLGVVGPN